MGTRAAAGEKLGWGPALAVLLLAGCATVPPAPRVPSVIPTIPAGRGGSFRVVSYLPDYACRQMRDLEKLGSRWVRELRLEGSDALLLSGVAEASADGGVVASWQPAFQKAHPGRWTLPAAEFAALRDRAHALGLAAGVSFGGEGWMKGGALGKVATDPRKRALFAAAVAEFCRAHRLGAVDFDWEYPVTRAEEEGYGQLIRAVKDAVAPAGVAVSVCVGGAESRARPHVTDYAIRAADYVHVMAYLPEKAGKDRMAADAERHLQYWLRERPCPPEKLLLGIGYYGRQAGPYTAPRPRHRSYGWIYRTYRPAPAAHEAGGYWFNGPEIVRQKVQLARRLGLGGVLVWEASQDLRAREPDAASLQHALRQAAPP